MSFKYEKVDENTIKIINHDVLNGPTGAATSSDSLNNVAGPVDTASIVKGYNQNFGLFQDGETEKNYTVEDLVAIRSKIQEEMNNLGEEYKTQGLTQNPAFNILSQALTAKLNDVTDAISNAKAFNIHDADGDLIS